MKLPKWLWNPRPNLDESLSSFYLGSLEYSPHKAITVNHGNDILEALGSDMRVEVDQPIDAHFFEEVLRCVELMKRGQHELNICDDAPVGY